MAKTKEKLEPVKEAKPDFSDRIVKDVLSQLGTPKNLHKAVAKNVYHSRYRVNLWCETKPDSYAITDSFFVVTNDQGEIVRCSPKIEKVY